MKLRRLLIATMTAIGMLGSGLLRALDYTTLVVFKRHPNVIHAAGEYQAEVNLSAVAINDGAFATSPVAINLNGTIISVPLNEGASIEFLSVHASAYKVVIDGTDPVTIAIKVVGSDGSAVATLATGISIRTAASAMADKTTKEIWRGSRILTAGQSVVYEITATTPDTAGGGYTLTAESRFKTRAAA